MLDDSKLEILILNAFSNCRELGLEHGYTFSLMKTNTELHGIPQKRIRTFYFFWKSPTVPLLHYKKNLPTKNFAEYLRVI